VVRSRIVLAGVSPKLRGLQWQSEEALRIGRSPNHCDVVLEDPSVSPRHAEVVATPAGWVVRDQGSRHGTLLNGIRLQPGGQRLRQDDRIQCGNLTVQVAVIEQASRAAPEPPPEPAAEPVPEPDPAVVVPAEARIKLSGTYLTIQTSVQHSWEEALQAIALDQHQNPRQAQHLLTLLRTGYHLTHLGSLDELLQSILDDTVAVLDAQRGAIVLADGPTGGLQLRAVSRARRSLPSPQDYSKTLAERSFQQGQSFLCSDVRMDARLLTAGSIMHGGMSSVVCALLRSPRQRLGVLHLDRGPFQEPFSREDFFLADAIAASVSSAIESAQLVARQRDEFVGTITALARAVEVRDQYTADHTQRVTDYALMLAEALKLSATERYYIQIGTPLHDVGKIGIEDAILRKPGRLTPEEFEQMKLHTLKGAAILETIPALKPVIPIVRHHHERWDGSGYPDRLAREQIAQVARIVAVADAFDAMTSDRPYRPALPPDVAFAELLDKAGSHFDPVCVEAFLGLRARVEELLK
jgi:HD-GYP domain-containing protein (c-di-GMP phosphodiesterase class II)/pSer/pThr/pTyr-binding forkhead associated (FHA) protein